MTVFISSPHSSQFFFSFFFYCSLPTTIRESTQHTTMYPYEKSKHLQKKSSHARAVIEIFTICLFKYPSQFFFFLTKPTHLGKCQKHQKKFLSNPTYLKSRKKNSWSQYLRSLKYTTEIAYKKLRISFKTKKLDFI